MSLYKDFTIGYMYKTPTPTPPPISHVKPHLRPPLGAGHLSCSFIPISPPHQMMWCVGYDEQDSSDVASSLGSFDGLGCDDKWS